MVISGDANREECSVETACANSKSLISLFIVITMGYNMYETCLIYAQ